MAKIVNIDTFTPEQWLDGKPILEIPEHSDIHFKEKQKNFLVFTESDEEKRDELKESRISLEKTEDGILVSTHYYACIREFSKFILKVTPKQIGDIELLGKMIAFCYIDKVTTFDLENIRFQKGDGPLDWLIMAFTQLCQRLIKRGLYKKYVADTNNVPYLKGKLLIKQQIQNTMKFNMKFNCEYDEFTSNNLENQIILYTLIYCYKITIKSDLKTKIQKLIHQIDKQVEHKPINLSHFKQIHYTRLNRNYENPISLSKLILEKIGFMNMKQMETKLIVPFSVYMPGLFEKFLQKLFEDAQKNSDWKVEPQDDRIPWKKNGEIDKEEPMGIQPDLVIYENELEETYLDEEGKEQKELIRENVKTVIDAKYMIDLKREERFQIAFYLHEYGIKRGFAICPTLKTTFPKNEDGQIMYEDNEAYLLRAEYQDKEIAVQHVNVDEFLEIIFSDVSQDEISRILEEIVPITP